MELNNIIESLSPHERKILPYLGLGKVSEIYEKSGLDQTSVMRALTYLQNKNIVKLEIKIKKLIEIGLNGAFYRKKGLPERRLLHLLFINNILSLEEAEKKAELSDEEFKASIGALKKKAMIEVKNGKLVLIAKKEEVSRKMPEEIFIESLPLNFDFLTQEQKYSYDSLKNRKEIIELRDEKIIDVIVTELGKKILSLKIQDKDFIEEITHELLKKDSNWQKKKFRRYDVLSPVPAIYGGKRHFVNQSIDYARKIWTEMGFKEMSGNLVQSSFWNFDALFTAQDHPVREMQDTFFIDKKVELPDKKLVKTVKEAHEKGVDGSKGWGGNWDEEEAKRLVLRTHTTCLSAKTLSELDKKNLPQKFFAIGKNFRNETVDWSHGFEFNQTEGIIVDRNASFRHLIGYLKEFFKKMGYEKIRIRPSYFPYTEPSLEIDVWHEEKQKWLELGGAGILRPEVTVPLLGESIPVLAWGPGFDRILTDYYGIKDLRELYKNDLDKLRKMKFWMKT